MNSMLKVQMSGRNRLVIINLKDPNQPSSTELKIGTPQKKNILKISY